MKYIVKRTESASKTLFWIVRDTDHPWLYHGPFADEAAAHAFARRENSENWKKLLREARVAREARRAMARYQAQNALAAQDAFESEDAIAA